MLDIAAAAKTKPFESVIIAPDVEVEPPGAFPYAEETLRMQAYPAPPPSSVRVFVTEVRGASEGELIASAAAEPVRTISPSILDASEVAAAGVPVRGRGRGRALPAVAAIAAGAALTLLLSDGTFVREALERVRVSKPSASMSGAPAAATIADSASKASPTAAVEAPAMVPVEAAPLPIAPPAPAAAPLPVAPPAPAAAPPAPAAAPVEAMPASPAPVAVAPEPAAARAAPASAPAEPAAAARSGMGMLSTAEATPGRRIFVDRRTVGQTPEAVPLKCGSHRVRIGSAGKTVTVDVPCGGEIRISDR